jgi:hypothetical protein
VPSVYQSLRKDARINCNIPQGIGVYFQNSKNNWILIIITTEDAEFHGVFVRNPVFFIRVEGLIPRGSAAIIKVLNPNTNTL